METIDQSKGDLKRVRLLRRLGIFLLLTLAILIAGVVILLLRARADRLRHEAWKQSIEQHGACVILAGYGGGPLARIPLLSRFAMSAQIEIFVPDDRTANEIVSMLSDETAVRRLWVHLRDVSDDSVTRLTAACPDADVTGYTPAPGSGLPGVP